MKYHKSKRLLCTLCALFLSLAFAAPPVNAATAFDPYYYYTTYPDVAAVTGFDPAALLQHYQSFGMKEGRFPNAQASWRAVAGYVDTEEMRTAFLMQIPSSDPVSSENDLPVFDPVFYYNMYPDVAATVGRDPQALLNHYFTYGFSEGRLPFFDAEPCTEVRSTFAY